MRAIVLGGTGFIGGRFLELYGDRFEQVLLVVRDEVATTPDLKGTGIVRCTVQQLLRNPGVVNPVDAVVHAAFDHEYRSNEQLLRSAWSLYERFAAKHFIYLSTFSVYDPFTPGVLTEDSVYSRLHDPYTLEKQRMERVLAAMAGAGQKSVTMLQPTVVYGMGGGWSQHALSGVLSEQLDLPMRGQGICNAVYVNDVATAIMDCILGGSAKGMRRLLVTGPTPVTWRAFYEGHAEVLSLKLPSEQFVDLGARLHHKLAVHLLLKAWFESPLGTLLFPLVRAAKRLRGRSVEKLTSFQALSVRLCAGRRGRHRPMGVTRINHAAQFVVRSGRHSFPSVQTGFEEGIAYMRAQWQAAQRGST